VSKNRNQNAVKHGAFAEVVILPGEDAKEFERLHQSLINEWKPDGPAELDAVWTLTKCLWGSSDISKTKLQHGKKKRVRSNDAERKKLPKILKCS
jgi:hypothetical protein